MTARRSLPAAVALVATAASASVALAHNKVTGTSPKRGAVVSKSISKATVTLNGQLRSGSVRVTGPDGRVVSVGRGGVDPRNVKRLTVPLRSGLRSGRYVARWSAKVPDGHTQRGSWSFRVR